MEITKVYLTLLKNESKVKALASIVFDDSFIVKGLKVIDNEKGSFVAMPNRKKDDEYVDVCHPVSKEFYQEIQTKVLEKYEQELILDEVPF